MLSPTHIVLLLLVILLALVVFGPKRLPELGQSVGKALQEFRKASHSTAEEVRAVTTTVTSAVAPVEGGEAAGVGASSDSETPAHS
ncbi:MAG: twin-arginine translocase TatA/TatE family subunit [Candidatus Dormibacteria bacterium]